MPVSLSNCSSQGVRPRNERHRLKVGTSTFATSARKRARLEPVRSREKLPVGQSAKSAGDLSSGRDIGPTLVRNSRYPARLSRLQASMKSCGLASENTVRSRAVNAATLVGKPALPWALTTQSRISYPGSSWAAGAFRMSKWRRGIPMSRSLKAYSPAGANTAKKRLCRVV